MRADNAVRLTKWGFTISRTHRSSGESRIHRLLLPNSWNSRISLDGAADSAEITNSSSVAALDDKEIYKWGDQHANEESSATAAARVVFKTSFLLFRCLSELPPSWVRFS
jgi:hypothetical protein